MKPIVLSIGTTHPWNVAGTGRDLVVGTARAVRTFTAVAAVSAQSGRGVLALHAVEHDVFAAQLETLPWEAAGAVRVGALPNASSVGLVAAALRAHPAAPAVVDPVFSASRGGALSDEGARRALRDELAVLGNVVLTPNRDEAAWLLARASIERAFMRDAAQALLAAGPLAVLLKGGDLEGDPLDVFASARGVESYSQPRIRGEMPGTGCTLAMALACELASGATMAQAVGEARAYVRAEIAKH